MTFLIVYGRLGRAAEREWTERNAAENVEKFLATPLTRRARPDFVGVRGRSPGPHPT